MKKFLYIGLTALAFAGCTSDGFDSPTPAEDGLLQVSGSVKQLMTRASGTSWDAADEIGLSTDVGHSNVRFTTAEGDGNFAASEKVYILGAMDKPHTVTAYYPYAADLPDDGVIAFDEPLDFMWAQLTGVTRRNPKANFNFAHVMSKICVKFVDNNPPTEAEDVTYEIRGLALAGSFDTNTGAITPAETAKTIENIALTLDEEKFWIVPAQTLAKDLDIALTYEGRKYVAKVRPDMNGGTEYHIVIDLTNRTGSEGLTVSGTINGWIQGEGGTAGVTPDTADPTPGEDDPPVQPKKEVTVNIANVENGTITVSHGGSGLSSGNKVEEGAILSITATPAEGYEIATVTANGTGLIASQGAYAYTVTSDVEAVEFAATFTKKLADVVISFNTATNGTLVVKANGINVSSGSTVKEGTVITLIATPDEGYEFASLHAGNTALTDGTTDEATGIHTATYTLGTTDPKFDAKFSKIITNTLKVGDYLMKDGTTMDPEDPNFNASNAVGVVYYVGNPQPSVLYPDKVSETQDALRRDYPNCTHGLAMAVSDAFTGTALINSATSTKNVKLAQWFDATGVNNSLYANLTTDNSAIAGYNNTQVMIVAGGDANATEHSNGDTPPEAWPVSNYSNFVKSLDDFNQKATNKVTGASAWYLPSIKELEIIQANFDQMHSKIIKTTATTAGNYYISSTENAARTCYTTNMTTTASGTYKSGKSKIRLCIAF